MEFKDYYKILGVSDTVDSAELKKAYRKLARKYHPDVSDAPDAEEQFKLVNEAYEVLKDPEKRQQYDHLKSAGTMGADGQFRAPPDWQNQSEFSHESFNEADMRGFSDFFESMFSSRRQGGPHQNHSHSSTKHAFRYPGEDVHIKTPIFIEEAIKGCERVIEFQVPLIDEAGYLSYTTKKLKVKIPPNSSPEKPMRLKGQGGKGHGGAPNGDLFIDLEFAPHPIYSIKGNDLYRKLAVAPWEAALGAKIPLTTLAGELQLTVPPNSQSGKQLRLKGQGFQGGDLYIELDIVLPKETTEKVKDLYMQLANEYKDSPRDEVAK